MTKKIPLVILVGPTAIGKTEVSIEIAKKLNGEIISADSAQIYKYMNIGTAKIKEEEKEGIPHYLIDIVNPDEEFTVADYKELATKYVEDIYNRGKTPIVVGGTGLYVNSLVYDLNFIDVPPRDEFREKCNKIADEYGNKYIYNKLKEIDPNSSNRINVNDRKRIIRALEVYNETGKPMSRFYKDSRKCNEKYNVIIMGLTMERKVLYNRINSRVDKMIEEGLIEEVKQILDMGYSEELNSLKALGYKEIILYLKGEKTLDETLTLLKRNTRRFAKRQLTWFRKDEKIKWINLDDFKNKYEVINYIIKYIKCELNLINKGGKYFER